MKDYAGSLQSLLQGVASSAEQMWLQAGVIVVSFSIWNISFNIVKLFGSRITEFSASKTIDKERPFY
jgi:hypothetical protein